MFFNIKTSNKKIMWYNYVIKIRGGNSMKKVFLFMLVLLMSVTLTGCGDSDKDEVRSLEDIMVEIYEEIPEDERPMMLTNTEVNEENIEYYLGSSDIEYEEAIARESGGGSIAHSVVLVRVKNSADVEEIKTKIKENVDPRKWICVGVEEEDVIVKNKGNLIILIMVDDEDTRETLEEGFDNL